MAAEAQPSLFLIVAGVVLVVLLIGAFGYGSRRRRRAGAAPPRPTEQNPLMQRPEDSWQTPQEHAREEDKHRYPGS
ncbi:DUF6479 family protein [Streptomyces sp. NRRL S-241]|uniref:DUF6479 family protein n=1 Tax=Streptomyces sp. NRRL S-241 TaxID=1463896 RepID=UPI001F25C467|nr:DUF6479 family protein [Streptomyces sp. NRRL S-241]